MFPNSSGGARGLAIFRRQVAYPCAKYKARKAFLLCSGVLYVKHSRVALEEMSKIGLELKVLCSEGHFLCIKEESYYRSLAKMGPWAMHITLCSDRGGWIFVTSAYYHEKAPMFNYIITTYNRILHTNTPAQCKLNSIWCLHLSSMCGFTEVDKWQRSNLLARKGLKVPYDEFYWQTKLSHVEKLSRCF